VVVDLAAFGLVTCCAAGCGLTGFDANVAECLPGVRMSDPTLDRRWFWRIERVVTENRSIGCGALMGWDENTAVEASRKDATWHGAILGTVPTAKERKGARDRYST
ncbi:unnamed protein product, partial [Ectocarpus sp. 13 AM-2016]